MSGEHDREAARRVKRLVRERLREDDRVVGVGIRVAGGIAVQVNVVDLADRPDLPGEIDGVPVVVVAVGRIRPLD